MSDFSINTYMKRLFILVCVAILTIAAYAQKTTQKEKDDGSTLVQANYLTLNAEDVRAEGINLFELKNSHPKRSKASGLYYLKPAGLMYRVWIAYSGDVWQGNTHAYAPANKKLFYQNMTEVNREHTKWWFDGVNLTSTYADEDYNCTVANDFGDRTYIPMLGDWFSTEFFNMSYRNDEITCWCGDQGYWMTGVNWPDYNYRGWMSFVDNKENYLSSTNGLLSNGYVMGSGTYTGTRKGYDANGNEISITGTFVADAVYESCPAPISPIYVYDVYLHGVCKESDNEPLKNGATLTMEIYDYETHELLHTLTSTTGCFRPWTTNNAGVLRFTKKTDDPKYGIIEEPFVIDKAIAIKISGFDQEGVNFGVVTSPIYDWDGEEELSEAYMTYKPQGDIVTSSFYHYSTVFAMALKFNATMDYLEVEKTLYDNNGEEVEGDFSTVYVSPDGTDCWNDGVGKGYDFTGAYVRTTREWGYSDPDAYSMADCPEWITAIYPQVFDDSLYNTYSVIFTAEPLPEGITERSADIYLNGLGIACETPIHVVQTNDVPANIGGITNTSEQKVATNGTYNVVGQRVNDTTKGILIKDGKKLLNK